MNEEDVELCHEWVSGEWLSENGLALPLLVRLKLRGCPPSVNRAPRDVEARGSGPARAWTHSRVGARTSQDATRLAHLSSPSSEP